MAVACVRQYSGVCSKLTGRDLDEVEKLCEVSCRFLRDNAEEFIHQRHDTPILVLYGNDATPSQTMVSIRCGSESLAKTFYRRGRDTKDLLAEKLFLTDGVSAMVVFADPQELWDKTVGRRLKLRGAFSVYRASLATWASTYSSMSTMEPCLLHW